MDTIWHQALRHHKFKRHLARIRDPNLDSLLNFFVLDALVIKHDLDLRLPTTSHDGKNVISFELIDTLNFYDKVILTWNVGLTDCLDWPFAVLLTDYELSHLVQGHVECCLVVELICEVVLQPGTIPCNYLLVLSRQGIVFARSLVRSDFLLFSRGAFVAKEPFYCILAGRLFL